MSVWCMVYVWCMVIILFIYLFNTNNCTKSCSQTNCLQAIITPCIRSGIDPASDSRFSVQAIGDFGGALFWTAGRDIKVKEEAKKEVKL